MQQNSSPDANPVPTPLPTAETPPQTQATPSGNSPSPPQTQENSGRAADPVPAPLPTVKTPPAIHTIAAASIVLVLSLGQWAWSPWPGRGWLVLWASQAWLVTSLATKSRRPTLAPCALAASCTIALALGQTAYGHGSMLGVGWGLGLCVWLAAIQAMITALDAADAASQTQ